MDITFILFTVSLTFALEANHETNHDNIAEQLRVAHYDCNQLQNSKTYTLNKIADCNFQPQDLEATETWIRVYQQIFKDSLDATMCKLNYQVRSWYCGTWSHSSNTFTKPTITSQFVLSPEQCRTASRIGHTTVYMDRREFIIPFVLDTKKLSSFRVGKKPEDKDSVYDCDG